MGSIGNRRVAGPKTGLALSVMRNCDWWHGHSRRLVRCSYRLAGQPACVQIFEYATKLFHIDPLLGSLASVIAFFEYRNRLERSSAASSSRRWMRSTGESANSLVVPPGMPGKTVI